MANSVEDIFTGLKSHYKPGILKKQQTFYISLGEDEKWTVTVGPDDCLVERGQTVQNADCVLKTDPDLFVKMWNGEYKPGMSDFMTGRIKSNNPYALKALIDAFHDA